VSKPEEPEREPIEVDLYGIRVPLKPKPYREVDPDSWPEVWRRVHASLRGIVTNVVGLINDVLLGARSVVRGIGDLPDAVQHRVRGAHDRADRAERASREIGPLDEETLRRRLESFIRLKEVQGYKVHLELREGKLIACFLPPMSDAQLAKVVAEAASSLPPGAPLQITGAPAKENSADD